MAFVYRLEFVVRFRVFFIYFFYIFFYIFLFLAMVYVFRALIPLSVALLSVTGSFSAWTYVS